jgi:DNA-directed RNA polymerase specialized sigma24 family protein
MKLSMQYLELWFKEAIRHYANVFATGVWDADDIAQEVLIHLASVNWPNRPTPSDYHGGRICKTPPGLVKTAIRNKSSNIRRRETCRLSSGSPSKLTPAKRPSPDTIAAIKEAILRLTARQTRCVSARLFPSVPCEATMRQVAKETNLSLATVSRTLAAARGILEKALLAETKQNDRQAR